MQIQTPTPLHLTPPQPPHAHTHTYNCIYILAISDGDVDTTKDLLSSIGTTIPYSKIRDGKGHNPLHIACLRGSHQCCRVLIDSAVRVHSCACRLAKTKVPPIRLLFHLQTKKQSKADFQQLLEVSTSVASRTLP